MIISGELYTIQPYWILEGFRGVGSKEAGIEVKLHMAKDTADHVV